MEMVVPRYIILCARLGRMIAVPFIIEHTIYSRVLDYRSPVDECTEPRYFSTIQRMENSLDEPNPRSRMIGRKSAFGDCRDRENRRQKGLEGQYIGLIVNRERVWSSVAGPLLSKIPLSS